MTLTDMDVSPDAAPGGNQQADRACEHLRGILRRPGLSRHEIGPDEHIRGLERIPCDMDARWRGISSCAADHLHLTLLWVECSQAHDADALVGGLRFGWDRLHG